MRTVDTPYGLLPVVDSWKECRHTGDGWTAVNEKGERLNIRRPLSESNYGPARMPDRDYVVIMRDAVGHEPRDVSGHVPVGVALIERTPRAKSKKKAPAF